MRHALIQDKKRSCEAVKRSMEMQCNAMDRSCSPPSEAINHYEAARRVLAYQTRLHESQRHTGTEGESERQSLRGCNNTIRYDTIRELSRSRAEPSRAEPRGRSASAYGAALDEPVDEEEEHGERTERLARRRLVTRALQLREVELRADDARDALVLRGRRRRAERRHDDVIACSTSCISCGCVSRCAETARSAFTIGRYGPVGSSAQTHKHS